MNDDYNVKSLADRVANLELKASYGYGMYTPFRTWRLRKVKNGVECFDCHNLCQVVETNGFMMVACPTCGHSVQKPTWQFEAVLDENFLYEIPVR